MQMQQPLPAFALRSAYSDPNIPWMQDLYFAVVMEGVDVVKNLEI